MCGIAVIRKWCRPVVSRSDLARMCSAIHHRGPDESGFALLDSNSLGIAHVRLSIVDLEGGQQPMATPDGKVWISFNGEIYDYKSQRDELLELGYPFKTKSDTEVILAAYHYWGLDFLEHLNGEFAFVIWDSNQRRLIAARDPVGVKPLYFKSNSQELLFCSEAKGILSLPRIRRQISPNYLAGTLMGIYDGKDCAFDGIQSVKPGHVMLIGEDGEINSYPWWNPRYEPDPKMSFEDAKDGLRIELRNAIRRRRVADVSVHSYLSGGIDSTLICGLMAEDNTDFTAYNIGFGKSVYDEGIP